MGLAKKRYYSLFVVVAIMFGLSDSLLSATAGGLDPVVVKVRFVHGTTKHGEMPHHLNQALHDLSKLVAYETNGEIELEIVTGRGDGVAESELPGIVSNGEQYQAAVIASLALPEIEGFEIFEIPYLFKDEQQAARYPASELAALFSSSIEERHHVKVLGHFLVSRTAGIAATDKLLKWPYDFTGRHINQGLDAFQPMWADIEPAELYSLPFSKIMRGELNNQTRLDTSIGVFQANHLQRLYTKFKFVTVSPGFYSIFRTLMINSEVWDSFSDSQKTGFQRAVKDAERLAFDYEQATTIYHSALNNAFDVTVHLQTQEERDAWAEEFSGKVRNHIIDHSRDPERVKKHLEIIKDM